MGTVKLFHFAGLLLISIVNFANSAEIQILSSSGTKAHKRHLDTVIENAYDNSDSSDRANCYLSDRGENGQPPSATFQIAQSIVQSVRLLNRNDAYYTQQNGLKVEVCSVYDICELCGEVQGAQAGMWSTLTCPEGLSGNRVKAVHTNPMLTVDICEIIINGESVVVEPAVRPIEPEIQPRPLPKPEILIQPRPLVEPAVRPLVEPAVQPLVEPAVQPLVEPAVQPLVEPAVEPLVEPAVQPLVEPAVQPMVQPNVATAVKPTKNAKKNKNKNKKNRRNKNKTARIVA